MALKTQWSRERLGHLFARYNRRYWRNRLPTYRVLPTTLEKAVKGRCVWGKRVIFVDVAKHRSDRDIRGTLLHEMAHAATRGGHDVKFFAQLERLLRRGAYPKVETGDFGKCRFFGEVVPRRFPLLRAKAERMEAAWANALNRCFAEKKLTTQTVEDGDIINYFKDSALVEGSTWSQALEVLRGQYPLADEAGRPLNAWARRILAKAKKVHAKARRDYLQEESLRKEGFKIAGLVRKGNSDFSFYARASSPNRKKSGVHGLPAK